MDYFEGMYATGNGLMLASTQGNLRHNLQFPESEILAALIARI